MHTCPSVINEITSKLQFNNINTFQKLISNDCPNALQAVLKPKNLRQVQNLKYLQHKKAKSTHNDCYNLHLVAQELQDYVFEIVTFPDLLCFFGNPDLLKELN